LLSHTIAGSKTHRHITAKFDRYSSVGQQFGYTFLIEIDIMKRTLLVMALAGASVAANAQSSVTLYGIVDAGVSYVNHSGTTTSNKNFKYDDGVASGSRWGLKGNEDLGNGLSALFVLENGFNSGTGAAGQGGAEFGRQAFVGLADRGVGTLTLGRQYSFSTDFLGPLSQGNVTADGNYGFHINDIDQLTSSRINNAVKFTSDNFYGFRAGAMYGFSNVAGAFNGSASAAGGTSRAYSFGLTYANGPLAVAAAYTDISYPASSTTAFATSIANVSTAGAGTAAGAVIQNLRTFGLGAKYVFGPATLFGMWTNTHFLPVATGGSTANIFEGGVKYAFTSALSLSGAYAFTDLTGTKSGHWHQVNLTLDYALSKRTDVYVLGVYQKASGSNGGVDNQAEIGSSSSYFGNSGAGSTNQIAARVGIRHRF